MRDENAGAAEDEAKNARHNEPVCDADDRAVAPRMYSLSGQVGHPPTGSALSSANDRSLQERSFDACSSNTYFAEETCAGAAATSFRISLPPFITNFTR